VWVLFLDKALIKGIQKLNLKTSPGLSYPRVSTSLDNRPTRIHKLKLKEDS